MKINIIHTLADSSFFFSEIKYLNFISLWLTFYISISTFTFFSRNTSWLLHRDTAVPAERNGDLQTLICVLVARPRRCLTLSNPDPWQNWMVAYLGYTMRMRTLFRGWPIMVNDTHTRRRMSSKLVPIKSPHATSCKSSIVTIFYRFRDIIIYWSKFWVFRHIYPIQ